MKVLNCHACPSDKEQNKPKKIKRGKQKRGRLADYLPSKSIAKFKSENTCSNPAKKTHQSRQRSSSLIQKCIENAINQSKQKPKIQNEASVEPTWAFGERIEGRGVVEQHEGSEENWPHEENMDENICWVAVISPIEREMPLEIEQSTPSH